MKTSYDAVVIGAGIGGLTVGTLLAKEGLRVLILEQGDRVGGRALSIEGGEISKNGIEWYRRLLKRQYAYLAATRPDAGTLIDRRMLDGYTLDIGYHAVSANGMGFMRDFEDLVGGLDGVVRHGARWASVFEGEIYRDVAGSQVDPRLREIALREGIPYLDFYTDPHRLSDEEIDKLENVSLQQWADAKGISRNEVVFDHLHSVATLFSTINNPADISIGDIFRYFKHAFGPKLASGRLRYNGGFVEGGVMRWSRAVAERFTAFGGDLLLNRRVETVTVAAGRVRGVLAVDGDGGRTAFEAPRVVSTIPAPQTFGVIDKRHFPAHWADRTEALYGYGSYTPYMGLNRLVMPEEEARLGLKHTCVLPAGEGFDHDVYICWNIQSAVDPSVAPEGRHLFTAYLPMTEKESLDRRLVGKLVRRLPLFMEKRYPGFGESVDWRLDVVCWKLEGVAKSVSQAGTQKVPVRSAHVGGLFFAGDTARGYGVAMDCAIASGMICAGEITGKDFGLR